MALKNDAFVTCLNCGQISPAGTQYCPVCHAAVDPALVLHLQYLYRLLTDLENKIRNGQGSQTIEQYYEEVAAHYKALSEPIGTAAAATAPTLPPPPVAPASPASSPSPAQANPAPTVPLPGNAIPVPQAGVPQSQWLTPNPPTAPQPGQFTPRPPFGQPGAPQPAPAAGATAPFSWSVFLADQAITIMAYLGAFLLLVATLIFELGGFANLGNQGKLAIVVGVYLLFAVAGFALRQAQRLRTVGGAYLAVFALMTPLVVLAVYLFALQGLGVPLQKPCVYLHVWLFRPCSRPVF